jgi:hypothetical protein
MIGLVFVGGLLAAIVNAVIAAVILPAIIGLVQRKTVSQAVSVAPNQFSQARAAFASRSTAGVHKGFACCIENACLQGKQVNQSVIRNSIGALASVLPRECQVM